MRLCTCRGFPPSAIYALRVLVYNRIEKTMDTQPLPSIRILLADTDAALCLTLRRVLQRLGCVVTIAQDTVDVLTRFASTEFDIVIVGVAPPHLDGVQILREIKRSSPETEIILLSDAQHLEQVHRGMELGAFAYLQTPLEDTAILGYLVARAMETRHLREQLSRQSQLPAPAPTPEPEEQPVYLMRDVIEATGNEPLSETMPLLAEAVASLLETDQALVLAYPGGGEMQIAASFGPDALPDQWDFISRPSDGFAYRVIAARKTLLDAIGGDASAPPAQIIGTPMLCGERALGVVLAFPLPEESASSTQVTWLELLAQQGAVAIELARLREENTRLAMVDPEIGVLKREFFLEQAEHEFRRSWRYSQPLTAIVVDVDNMSAINANYGREFGNRVLRRVAQVCRSSLRSIDLVGRYDEDAFALLLLMTGREGARTVAERLRSEISVIQIQHGQDSLLVSASLGVCAYPRSGCASIFDLLSLAQQAQRDAQRRGANQIAYA